jgi:hypothetical protein
MTDRELSIHQALNHHQAQGTIRSWRLLPAQVKGGRRWNIADYSSEKWLTTREAEVYCWGLAAAAIAASRQGRPMPDRDLCLEVGTTDDGERWACCHPAGHVRYWFDHMALTNDPARPVVMWRRHDGLLARYLQPIERQEEPSRMSDAEWEASARR